MTAVTICKQESLDSFNRFNPNEIIPGGRLVVNNYRFDATANAYLTIGQGVLLRSERSEDLINQARRLRKRHFWRFWRLRAPNKRVIEASISVINYCPSELFLDGYSIDNYGNGTIVMMRRSTNYMTTINIGESTLSYAKLRISDHKVIASGKCAIEKELVSVLFKKL